MENVRRFCVAAATFIGLFGATLLLPVNDGAAQRGGPRMDWGRDLWMPGWMQRRHWDPRSMGPDMRARMRRHWTYMHEGLPKEYAYARSDVPTTPRTIVEGGKLYAENCASCHGKTGLGDGAAGKSLAPSPALLAYLINRPMAADEYLLWSISEGGKQFGTDMPAFKDTLKRDQIWKIIAYMRDGFPAVAGGYGDLKFYSTKGDFEDVAADVQDAIINRGYVIDYRGFIGKMLKRTAKDVGGTKALYKDAEFYQFCSAKLSRQTMEADPRNIGYCPYVIVVYEQASTPGTIHVGYRRPAMVGSERSKKTLSAIDKLLDGIAREATQ